MVVQDPLVPEQLQVHTGPGQASRAARAEPETGSASNDRSFLPILREIMDAVPDAFMMRIEGPNDPDAVRPRPPAGGLPRSIRGNMVRPRSGSLSPSTRATTPRHSGLPSLWTRRRTASVGQKCRPTAPSEPAAWCSIATGPLAAA